MGTLATEIRERLGPRREAGEHPLVSIVVLNRDGADHLRALLAGLSDRTDYPRLELIVVDNASGDDSLEFLRTAEAPFPIAIVANHHNESFSDANNKGAELARGELLLLLNNDAEPFEAGWLHELVACLQATRAGAVVPTLISPIGQGSARGREGGGAGDYRFQAQRVRLRGDGGNLGVDYGPPRRLFDAGFGEDVDSAFPIGACVLIERDLFLAVGGFTHGYFYGGEDVDLFLKLRARGLRVLYSGRSTLLHGVSSTRRRLIAEDDGFEEEGNTLLLMERWGPRVWREYELDRLAGGGLWAVPDSGAAADPQAARARALRLGFCLRADRVGSGGEACLPTLEEELDRRGHRRLTLRGGSIEDPRGLYHDVAVHLRGGSRYVPKPAQLNVLWAVDGAEALSGLECDRYHLCAIGDPDQTARLRRECRRAAVVGLDPERAAAQLIAAALERHADLDLPLRIAPA